MALLGLSNMFNLDYSWVVGEGDVHHLVDTKSLAALPIGCPVLVTMAVSHPVLQLHTSCV